MRHIPVSIRQRELLGFAFNPKVGLLKKTNRRGVETYDNISKKTTLVYK